MFEALIVAASFVAGAIASVAGFGIGSILTPVLSLETGTRVAVAAISVPHFAGTLVRFWILRRGVDRRVVLHFGVLSAAGGLCGALLHAFASNPVLTVIFAALLIFAGLGAITGYARKMRFGRRAAWFAGAVSGMLGGLVGNQGGIRSAALLGFGLQRDAFVATAAAIGLIVDAARMPVYFATSANQLLPVSGLILLLTAGVLAGTLSGARVLRGISEQRFHRLVGIFILALGIFMLFRAAAGR
jgi:uncharacterized membrane protein YfcA